MGGGEKFAPPSLLTSRTREELRRVWPYYAPSLADAGGAWPPKTYPCPFSNVAPRRDRCPLTRGNSKGSK